VDVAYKTKLRHRMHSKKWHQVYNEALSRGPARTRQKYGLASRHRHMFTSTFKQIHEHCTVNMTAQSFS
jgi:hypothetical protein